MKINSKVVEQQLKLNNYYYIPNTKWGIFRANNGDYLSDTKEDFLGEGTYGIVYSAHKFNLQTAKVDKKEQFVIKILKTSLQDSPEIEKEIAYLKSYGEKVSNLVEAFVPISNPDNCNLRNKLKKQPFYFFIMPYNGTPLASFNKDLSLTLNPELLTLNFSQRIKLILQGALYLNSYHHHTPQTGEVIIHKDIKPQNVLLKTIIRNNHKEHFLSFCDYGLATKMPDPTTSDPNPVIKTKAGTKISSAPELNTHQQASTRSDIWSFGKVIIALLNGTDPYASQVEIEGNDYEGFLQGLTIPGPFSTLINKLLRSFSEKTLEMNPQSRANTKECLLFFTLLNKYNCMAKYAESKNPPLLQDYLIIIAKLSLVCINLFDNPSWETFDFDDAPEFCALVAVIQINESFITEERLNSIATMLEDHDIKNDIKNALTNTKESLEKVKEILDYYEMSQIKSISSTDYDEINYDQTNYNQAGYALSFLS